MQNKVYSTVCNKYTTLSSLMISLSMLKLDTRVIKPKPTTQDNG
jgi:hypothetical protein